MSTHAGSEFNGWRELMNAEARRRYNGPCICTPGDPCDYHAALGVGSVADRPDTNSDRMEATERHVPMRDDFHTSE